MSLELYGFSFHKKTESKEPKKRRNYELEYYEKKLKEMEDAEKNKFSSYTQPYPNDDFFNNGPIFNFFPSSKLKLSYNFSSASSISERLAERAKVDAYNTNTTGWCYRSVAKVLADEGLANLHGESAYMASAQLIQNKNFSTVKNGDIKPGDIIVIGNDGTKNPTSDLNKHGHIMIVGTEGQGYSDHAQQIDLSKYKGRSIQIFRAKSA